MPIDYDNKKIIPQPFDDGTPAHTTLERVIARLPSLEGKGGKLLMVSNNEEGTEWVAVSGVTHDYRDLTYKPKINGVEVNGEQTSINLKVLGEDDTQTMKNKTIDCATGATGGNNSISNVPVSALAKQPVSDAGKMVGVTADGSIGFLNAITGKTIQIVDTLPSSPVDGTLYFEKSTGTVAYYG